MSLTKIHEGKGKFLKNLKKDFYKIIIEKKLKKKYKIKITKFLN